MSWYCDHCARGEEELEAGVIDAVCHHCGKLLCTGCRHEIVDTALVGGGPGVAFVAYHCAPCRRAHHPRSVPVPRLLRR